MNKPSIMDFRPMNAIVTDFDLGTSIADSILLLLFLT